MACSISRSDFPPTSAFWDKAQYVRLLHHLHGTNAPDYFVSGFIGEEANLLVSKFRRNRTRGITEAITSTWKTIAQSVSSPYSLVLLPNPSGISTWVVWDFDFHERPEEAMAGPMVRDLKVFRREADKLFEQGFASIVEHSGRGWHCWLISKQPRPAKEWHAIRSQIEKAAKFAAKPEFLPAFTGKGKGCRAPGSANISTWHPTREDWLTNMILWETVSELGLPQTASLELKNKKTSFYSSNGVPLTDDSHEEPEATPADDLITKCRIVQEHTRHKKLLQLVSEGCHQFGREVLRKGALDLYQNASPACSTPLEQHQEEYENMYEDAWRNLVMPKLSAEEAESLADLHNISEREIFIIIQNYARLREGTFFFSTKRVGQCIGRTFQRVHQVRETFVAKRFIARMPGSYVPRVRAPSYRWLLPLRAKK